MPCTCDDNPYAPGTCDDCIGSGRSEAMGRARPVREYPVRVPRFFTEEEAPKWAAFEARLKLLETKIDVLPKADELAAVASKLAGVAKVAQVQRLAKQLEDLTSMVAGLASSLQPSKVSQDFDPLEDVFNSTPTQDDVESWLDKIVAESTNDADTQRIAEQLVTDYVNR